MQGAVSFFVYGKNEKCTICNQMNKNAIICIFDKSDFWEKGERKNKNVLHFPENALEVQHKRNGKKGTLPDAVALVLHFRTDRFLNFLHFCPEKLRKTP